MAQPRAGANICGTCRRCLAYLARSKCRNAAARRAEEEAKQISSGLVAERAQRTTKDGPKRPTSEIQLGDHETESPPAHRVYRCWIKVRAPHTRASSPSLMQGIIDVSFAALCCPHRGRVTPPGGSAGGRIPAQSLIASHRGGGKQKDGIHKRNTEVGDGGMFARADGARLGAIRSPLYRAQRRPASRRTRLRQTFLVSPRIPCSPQLAYWARTIKVTTAPALSSAPLPTPRCFTRPAAALEVGPQDGRPRDARLGPRTAGPALSAFLGSSNKQKDYSLCCRHST